MSEQKYIRIVVPAVLALLLLALFWKPLFVEPLFTPDSAPLFPEDFRAWMFESMANGAWGDRTLGEAFGADMFHPTKLLQLLLPPMAYNVAVYIVDPVLVFLAMLFFLRGRGLNGAPAWLPALCAAFAGYYFTLVSAGHRGVFDMFPWALLLFGLVDRALTRGAWFYYAAAGLCLGFGFTNQPDVMVLFSMLAAAYGVFRLVSLWPKDHPKKFLVKQLAGTAITAVIFIAVSLSMFGTFFTKTLPRRQAVQGKTAPQQWEFATNWSMPPGDLLEFVAPTVFGIESGDRKGPYWGGIGRSMNWKKTRQGFPSYRQHTVYFGVIPLVFALFAMAWVIRNKDPSGAGARREVWFWFGAAAICLLLSLGRHFPLYRLFYMLPMASSIRAPVKFIHLFNVCITVLFAFGLSFLLALIDQAGKRGGEAEAGNRKKKKKKTEPAPFKPPLAGGFLIFCLVAGGLLLLATTTIGVDGGRFKAEWAAMGLESMSTIMARTMTAGLVHGGLLFLAAAAVFGTVKPLAAKPAYRHAVVLGLIAVTALDIYAVNRKYVRTRPAEFFKAYYEPGPIAKRILADGRRMRLSDLLSSRGKFDLIWVNHYINRVPVLEPRSDRQPTAMFSEFYGKLATNPPRLWQLTSTGYVAGPVQKLQALAQRPDIEIVERYRVSQGRLAPAAGPQAAQAPHLLLRYDSALPRYQVFHAWRNLEPGAALEELANPDFDPAAEVLVSGGPQAPPGPPAVSPVTEKRFGRTRIVLHAKTGREGILLLNDAWDPNWKVRVDGKPAELLRCNYLMRGVHLPAGDHQVEFSFTPYRLAFLVSLLTMAGVGVWGIVFLINNRKSTS